MPPLSDSLPIVAILINETIDALEVCAVKEGYFSCWCGQNKKWAGSVYDLTLAFFRV